MIVVSDTTAISNLLAIGRIDLFNELFEDVAVPQAVYLELVAWHGELPGWIKVMPLRDGARADRYKTQVHAGEAEAIALALETGADWVVIDDSDGRRLARAEGAPVIGLVGVLLLAKQESVLAEVKTVMDSLRREAGFFLTESVYAEALRLAGEIE